MAAAAKKATHRKPRPHLALAPTATPTGGGDAYPGGWVDLEATSDVGGHCELVIRRRLNADSAGGGDPDPRLDINFRRRASILHPDDDQPAWVDEWINDIRASDLDSLVKALQQAIAVARFHGVIPGPLSDDTHRALLGRAVGGLNIPLTPAPAEE